MLLISNMASPDVQGGGADTGRVGGGCGSISRRATTLLAHWRERCTVDDRTLLVNVLAVVSRTLSAPSTEADSTRQD